MKLPQFYIDDLIKRAIQEDINYIDVTTDYLLDADAPDSRLHDASNSYTPSLQKAISGEWSLRESEQKLIMAFRYLNKDAQAEVLRMVERIASEQYEQRRSKRQNKTLPSPPK